MRGSDWQNVMDEIRRNERVSEMAYSAFFSGIRPISTEGGKIVIEAINIFIKAQMESKYNSVLKKSFAAVGFEVKSLEVVLGDGEKKTVRRGVEVLARDSEMGDRDNSGSVLGGSEAITGNSRAGRSVRVESFAGGDSETGLNKKYRFSNYVVGDNNNLAVSAAQAVVEKPGEKYNPYFIYGGPGVGKTHLIQAIGNELLEKSPNIRVRYTTIEQFYHEFVEMVRKDMKKFTAKYRKVDVLIVDDFQFIVGKEKSQEEFFHTFNDLHQRGKQIIVSCDRMPTQLADVDARLSSRLMGGVPIDIQMPGFELRCAIIKSKCEILGAEIDDRTVEYLAENIKTNVRELEGQLQKLLALSEMRGVSPNEIIDGGYLGGDEYKKGKAVSPKLVVDKVARFYDLTAKDLLGTKRVSQIKTARQIAMYLMSEELGLSTVRIGREFGKDHTTIMHGVKKIKADMRADFYLREQLGALREKIYG